jgi:lauroyl/myristoyl acyltransferase
MSDPATAISPADDAATAPRRERMLGWWPRLSFGCVRAVLRVTLAMFGLRGLYRICRGFGTLEYLINHKRRRRIRAMLRSVFGRELEAPRRRALVRRHFMRQRCDKTFYLIGDMLTSAQMKNCLRFENREMVDAAFARGKGIYALLSHHGAHHIIGQTMSTLGYRVGAVRDPNEGPLRTYMQSLWAKKHPDLPQPEVIYADEFVRRIYRLLRENCALGSALDVTRVRDPRLKSVPVQIFGETRHFLTGTLQIALRCRATIVQAFLVSCDDFVYQLEVLGPMADPDTATESPELIADIMQRYADNIAEYARRYPDQLSRV